jgi:hypothetical protein
MNENTNDVSEGLSAVAKREQETNTRDNTKHTHHVYSTLPTSTTYNTYVTNGGEKDKIHSVVGRITIHGRSGVPDRFLRTPQGTVTPITDAERDVLEKDGHFQIHQRNGFVKIVKIGAVSDKQRKNVINDMSKDAAGKPLTKETLNKGTNAKDKIKAANSGDTDTPFVEELS